MDADKAWPVASALNTSGITEQTLVAPERIYVEARRKTHWQIRSAA
jgi:hypothetical protein